MRVLARDPHGHGLVAFAPLGDDAAGLDRCGRQALLQNSLLDHHVGISEGRVGVGAVRQVPGQVVGQGLVGLGAAGLQGLLQVHHRRQGLVVHRDQRGGVGRAVLGLCDHHGHRLTLEADLLLGEREPVGHRLLLRHKGRRDRHRARDHLLDVLGHVDGQDARRRTGGRRVDRLDSRVGMRAADERHVGGPGPHEVVCVSTLAADQARVLATVDLGPDHRRDGHLVTPPPGRRRAGRPSRCRSWWPPRTRPPSRCSRTRCSGRGCPPGLCGCRPRSGSDSARAGTRRP